MSIIGITNIHFVKELQQEEVTTKMTKYLHPRS